MNDSFTKEHVNSLVSIVVIAYNSSQFILEALESARIQTYQNIELIISDDASNDNTVEICRDWIMKYKKRFTRTEIIEATKNTGVAANTNRGLLAAKGKWIKTIAGDDALLGNCIEDNVNYILKHLRIDVLYSYNRMYRNTFTEENYIDLNPKCSPTHLITPEISANEQYRLLLLGNKVPFTPSFFVSRKACLDAGLPDVDLYSEDYQTILKLTKKGYKLHFMETETVKYRQHDSAIHNRSEEVIIKPYIFKMESCNRRYVYPNIPWDLRLSHKYKWVVLHLFKIRRINRVNQINMIIYNLLTVVLNPFKYIIYFKTHYIKKYKGNVFYQ